MLRKTIVTLAVVILCGAAFATPARAQSQTVTFNIGKFWVQGEAARLSNNDVLAAELNAGYYDALLFNLNDFNGVTVGGDWLVGLGDFLDAGIGASYYSRSVPSISANLVNEATGADIAQTLRLRIVPITATVRFLPLGRHAVVEPYIGAGVGFFNWRYSEVGQFVNPADATIFSATYEQSGWAVGPVILGGVHIPFGQFVVGGEVRYQRAKGNLSTDFLGDNISLTGVTGQATFGVRF